MITGGICACTAPHTSMNGLYSLPKPDIRPARQNNYHFLANGSRSPKIPAFVYDAPRSPILRILLSRGRPTPIMGHKVLLKRPCVCTKLNCIYLGG
jgi:hypothetical protein